MYDGFRREMMLLFNVTEKRCYMYGDFYLFIFILVLRDTRVFTWWKRVTEKNALGFFLN